jgi:hypothetical protein
MWQENVLGTDCLRDVHKDGRIKYQI